MHIYDLKASEKSVIMSELATGKSTEEISWIIGRYNQTVTQGLFPNVLYHKLNMKLWRT